MKVLKYIISLVVLLLCFTLNGELYQAHLQNFTNGYYYFELDAEDKTQVCAELSAAAEKCGQIVFAIDRQNLDAFRSRITVFMAGASKKAFAEALNVAEGEACSCFSGQTELYFCPLTEIPDAPGVNRFFFSGSKEEVLQIRQIINMRIGAGAVHKEAATGTELIVYALWVLAFGFLTLLTWMDIQFSRKVVFLRVSMGASIRAEICKCILRDLLLFSAVFAAVYSVLGRYFYISFRMDVVLLTFLAFCIGNSLLYLSFARGGYKEIIYGANIDQKLLPNAYLMKALVLILLVIAGACTLTLINKNAGWLQAYQRIDKMEDYYTIQLTYPGSRSDLSPEEEEARYARETRLYLEAYRENRVLLANSWITVREGEPPQIVMNAPAIPMLLSRPEYFQNCTATFTVFVPEQYADRYSADDIENVAEYGAEFFGFLEAMGTVEKESREAIRYSYEAISYPTTEALYFDLRRESKLPYGFARVKDPLIVCCNVTAEQIDALMDAGAVVRFNSFWESLMFAVNDTDFFSEEAMHGLRQIDFNNVVAQCGQYKSSLLRVLFINTALSLVLLALSIVLISVIVRLEYLVNAKELALKRILGHSVLQRNSAAVLLNLFSILIALITGWILSEMTGLFDKLTLCAVCLLVSLIDAAISLSNMLAAERKNIAQILKGGCL